MPKYTSFHIHGDNIVECERTLSLIENALGDKDYTTEGPFGSHVCPSFRLKPRGGGESLEFTFFPGYGRWNSDILQMIRNMGGTLREAADVILSGINQNKENPLVAIEYCGALPAGNQAWQRSGRAYSYGLARVPYLYVAEIGGYELGADRVRKAERLPNPAVPFSYLTFSIAQDTPVLPIFISSPGAHEDAKRQYGPMLGDKELIGLVRAIILGEDKAPFFKSLKQKVLAFVKLRASLSRRDRTLTPDQWQGAYDAAETRASIVPYLLTDARLEWSKTAYIDGLTDTAKKLMAVGSDFAVGLTSADLPMCLIPKANRPAFSKELQKLYPGLPKEFQTWLSSAEDLAICWVMGFKPRGDDARPDRGLPPLARMLTGPKAQLLAVVYGPAPKTTWPLLKNSAETLMKNNGLWESILQVSDALLVDSATDKVTQHGFLRKHWTSDSAVPVEPTAIVAPFPLSIGEQDIDTILHTIFARLAKISVFEGMCNPPGGDWSGISLQSLDRSQELRWLSLPRVSGEHAKRPDHVFQIYRFSKTPILMAIESKEQGRAVEDRIGPRLKAYISELLKTPASIQRVPPTKSWIHSKVKIDVEQFALCSGVAFLSGSTDSEAIAKRADVDVAFAFSFKSETTACEIKILPRTAVGQEVGKFLLALDISGYTIPLKFQ